MRGVAVASRLGVPFFDLSELPRVGRVRTLVLVKIHARHADRIRRICGRLIYDPLDAWLMAAPMHRTVSTALRFSPRV